MASRRTTDPRDLDTRTRRVAPSPAGAGRERVPALTVLGHPRATRVGDRATLLGLRAGETVSLSRATPIFSAVPSGGAPQPLADPFLSRHSLASLILREGVLFMKRDHGDAIVRLDGVDLGEVRRVDDVDLERGVVVELGDRVVLLLHHVDTVRGRRPPSFDLVGESDAMLLLRKEMARVATTDLRILLRGATGSGKELVATAIHRASARAKGPFEAVNMGAVQPSLSASALFGHVRGAFSGAVADHQGHFEAADGGTLFLDEVGDTDASVQAMMLRTLETGDLQRVGERRVRKVDVRLLAATDADLEAAVAAGRFREPLLHRLGEITLRIPALHERRDDVGRLVVHFLRELLDAEAQARLLDGEATTDWPWLPAPVMARLARAPWTGNVRQLRNVVRQLVVLGGDEPTLSLGPGVLAALREEDPPLLAAGPGAAPTPLARPAGQARPVASGEGPAPTSSRRGKRPQDLSDDEVVSALEQTGWKRAAAADLLGIARSSLYAIIAGNPRIARSQNLTAPEVSSALARHGGNLAEVARELRVSEHGLKLRMQALGIEQLG